jgi:hypothetical protein
VPSLVADSREPTEPLPQPDDDELTRAIEHATEAADADVLVAHR